MWRAEAHRFAGSVILCLSQMEASGSDLSDGAVVDYRQTTLLSPSIGMRELGQGETTGG
jgi:hypothetical protein